MDTAAWADPCLLSGVVKAGHVPHRRLLHRFLAMAWALLLTLGIGVGSASALSVADLPSSPPEEHVLDGADVLSRAATGEIDKLLESFSAERVDARLITVKRLDYGLSLDSLGQQLIERWDGVAAADGRTSQPFLLLLIDGQSKATAIHVSPSLKRQLPEGLLRSTARTTMAYPLRGSDRYRQAAVDGLDRLATVLRGGEDPGEPLIEEAQVVATNVPTREETASSNATTWVIVLLVVGSVVPMATWWVFSR